MGICTMAPMKTMKAGAKAMTKTQIAEALAGEFEMKRTACAKVIDSLAAIATKEVKSAGKFTIPGVCTIKTRLKPARKAGKRMAFGKEVFVKAQPAKTVVKAFPVSALKSNCLVRGSLVVVILRSRPRKVPFECLASGVI